MGERMPAWVQAGYAEYARRLPPECAMELTEIPLRRRTKGIDLRRIMHQEGEHMLSALPPRCGVWALTVDGKQRSTEQLAAALGRWMAAGRDQVLLVGGPEGLDPQCVARADGRWSLSTLTLPHPLVRVIVAEQIYRAWTILAGHPYHR